MEWFRDFCSAVEASKERICVCFLIKLRSTYQHFIWKNTKMIDGMINGFVDRYVD